METPEPLPGRWQTHRKRLLWLWANGFLFSVSTVLHWRQRDQANTWTAGSIHADWWSLWWRAGSYRGSCWLFGIRGRHDLLDFCVDYLETSDKGVKIVGWMKMTFSQFTLSLSEWHLPVLWEQFCWMEDQQFASWWCHWFRSCSGWCWSYCYLGVAGGGRVNTMILKDSPEPGTFLQPSEPCLKDVKKRKIMHLIKVFTWLTAVADISSVKTNTGNIPNALAPVSMWSLVIVRHMGKVHTLHVRSDRMKSTWQNMAVFVQAKKVLNMANIPCWTIVCCPWSAPISGSSKSWINNSSSALSSHEYGYHSCLDLNHEASYNQRAASH